jgi:hypothetical protein
MDILWKTFSLSSPWSYGTRSDQETPHKYGVLIALHRQAARQHGRVAKRASIISFGRTPGDIARHADERKVGGRQAHAARRAKQLLPENLCRK